MVWLRGWRYVMATRYKPNRGGGQMWMLRGERAETRAMLHQTFTIRRKYAGDATCNPRGLADSTWANII